MAREAIGKINYRIFRLGRSPRLKAKIKISPTRLLNRRVDSYKLLDRHTGVRKLNELFGALNKLK